MWYFVILPRIDLDLPHCISSLSPLNISMTLACLGVLRNLPSYHGMLYTNVCFVQLSHFNWFFYKSNFNTRFFFVVKMWNDFDSTTIYSHLKGESKAVFHQCFCCWSLCFYCVSGLSPLDFFCSCKLNWPFIVCDA